MPLMLRRAWCWTQQEVRGSVGECNMELHSSCYLASIHSGRGGPPHSRWMIMGSCCTWSNTPRHFYVMVERYVSGRGTPTSGSMIDVYDKARGLLHERCVTDPCVMVLVPSHPISVPSPCLISHFSALFFLPLSQRRLATIQNQAIILLSRKV